MPMKKGQTIPDSHFVLHAQPACSAFSQSYAERFSQHVQSYGIETPCVVDISEVSVCEF